MNREDMISRVTASKEPWDVLVIGGGATGLGTAVDAAARGYRTVLLEQHDFGKATSSRSTKIAHGGVRYLQQGDIGLVFEALHERGLMIQNAPHLVTPLTYVLPAFHWWELPFYGTGLKMYDALAGRRNLGWSKILGKQETLRHLPTIREDRIVGSVLYMDGQFDDARLLTTLSMTFFDLGGTPLNYCPVKSLIKENGKVVGVETEDAETGEHFQVRAKIVINATGIFTDFVRRMDEPHAEQMLSVSQGTHIVVDRSFLPTNSALMIPKTDDGRVLFGIPWYDRLVIGTTDIPRDEIPLEPKPLEEEVHFLVEHSSRYLSKKIRREDVLSVFSGLRPLVKAKGAKTTSKLSRSHRIEVSDSHLLTITGGKWTTYRRMAQDTIDKAIEVAGLEFRPSTTKNMHLHGYRAYSDHTAHSAYGADLAQIRQLEIQNPNLSEKIHARLPYTYSEILWSIRHEMARQVEDVLARRTRSILLDARASIDVAPTVAQILCDERRKDSQWKQKQVDEYVALAKGYLPKE